MGVFAVIGLIIIMIAVARGSVVIGIIGLLTMGAGIAGNSNGY